MESTSGPPPWQASSVVRVRRSSSSGMMSRCSGSSMARSNSSSSRSSSATGRASSSAVSLPFNSGASSPASCDVGLVDRVDPEGHSADGQHVAYLQRLLPEHPLAVDIRPVGAAQVAEHEPLAVFVKLAVASADLGGADPDQAVVVAADAVDSVDQLQVLSPARSPRSMAMPTSTDHDALRRRPHLWTRSR